MWLDAFHKGTVATSPIKGHATFLRDSRGWATVYLQAAAQHFPEGARVPLRTATAHYEGVSDAMEDLLAREPYDASNFQEGAKILSRALEHERAALANLQKMLDAR